MNTALLGKLIGLVRCIEGNEYLVTPDTNDLIFEGLKMAVEGNCDDGLIQKIENEKKRLAPDCFACATPCGKRDDMDFSLLTLDDAPVQKLKEELISAVKQAVIDNKNADYATALFLYGLIGTGEEPIIRLLNTLK